MQEPIIDFTLHRGCDADDDIVDVDGMKRKSGVRNEEW
jgi:hypothetical protein